MIIAWGMTCIQRHAAMLSITDRNNVFNIPLLLTLCNGVGIICGPILTYVSTDNEMIFYTLSALHALCALRAALLPLPRESCSSIRSETSRLLQDYPSAMPSPIIGSVFLTLQETSREEGGCSYDPQGTWLVMLGTFLATWSVGVQFGLGAFLTAYLIEQWKVSLNTALLWTSGYWSAAVVGYTFAWALRHINLVSSTTSLFLSSCLSLVAAIVMMQNNHISPVALLVFGVAWNGCFPTALHVLREHVPIFLQRRMPSLIIFGAACGEMFVPLVMGFFMGSNSGAQFGTMAVWYITSVLACFMTLTVVLLLATLTRDR